MGIKKAYMVPHPPLIVPAVGKGGESKISDTAAAYERAALDIAGIQPDTIIIISPHSVMYSDYFHISPGIRAKGDLGRFGAPQISFDEEYDSVLVDRLTEILDKDGFPGGTATGGRRCARPPSAVKANPGSGVTESARSPSSLALENERCSANP